MLTFVATGVRCSLLIRVRTCAVAPTVLPDVARDFGLPHSSPHEFVLTRVPWYPRVVRICVDQITRGGATRTRTVSFYFDLH